MLIENIKPNFEFRDERGSLVQLVREGYKQFNVITSKKGVLRGNHYHRHNREAFYVVSGKFRLDAFLGDERESHEYSAGDMFVIPPMVVHSFSYLEDTLLVSMYSEGVEEKDGSKDIVAVS